MQFKITIQAVLAAVLFGSMVSASPVPCPDVSMPHRALHRTPDNMLLTYVPQSKRDQILMGKLEPEACCSYGICKGDVVVQGG